MFNRLNVGTISKTSYDTADGRAVQQSETTALAVNECKRLFSLLSLNSSIIVTGKETWCC